MEIMLIIHVHICDLLRAMGLGMPLRVSIEAANWRGPSLVSAIKPKRERGPKEEKKKGKNNRADTHDDTMHGLSAPDK